MGTSNQEKFRNSVRDLNAQFEEWIREKLRSDKSTSLRQGIEEYRQKLEQLEKEWGLSAGTYD